VAGTVCGTTWGIAKNVKLSPVRVLNCAGSGTYDQVIAGVDWVTANHVKPAVANMSLGGSVFAPLDNAIRASINAGVTYVVAAGNSYGASACNYSPSGVREALTVGVTTMTDARAVFSNAGECVDLFAPGVGITSAWYTSPTATAVLDGTSMASPHVAGVAALYLEANPGASATQVFDAIREGTTKGIVTNANSAKNDLLYSLFITSGPPPQEFTLTATGYRVDKVKYVDLVWAGATSANVDIYRDKVLIITTANDGAHTDGTAPAGRGTHSYRVCEAGTKVCSNIATVTF
jgi:serine protease